MSGMDWPDNAPGKGQRWRMVARDVEAVEVEELGLSHEFAICRGQDDRGWESNQLGTRGTM